MCRLVYSLWLNMLWTALLNYFEHTYADENCIWHSIKTLMKLFEFFYLMCCQPFWARSRVLSEVGLLFFSWLHPWIHYLFNFILTPFAHKTTTYCFRISYKTACWRLLTLAYIERKLCSNTSILFDMPYILHVLRCSFSSCLATYG